MQPETTPGSRNHSLITIAILFVILLAMYGQFVGSLGFYWDDWNKILLFERYGSVKAWAIEQRPFSYILVDSLINLFGVQPFWWHVFQFCLRLVAAVVVYFLIQAVYPPSRILATVVSLLFLTFPGFTFHAIAQTHSIGTNFALLLFLLSIWLMVLSLTVGKSSLRWLYGALAVFCMTSLYLQQEYFVTAELTRPLLIWYILGRSFQENRKRLKRTVINWLPYLVPFAALIFYRLFIYHPVAQFASQTHLLHYVYLQDPLNTFYTIARRVIRDIYQAFIWLWIPDVNLAFSNTTPRYTFLRMIYGLLFGLLTAWLIARAQRRFPDEMNGRQGRTMILHGIIYFFFSMAVIWLTMNYISATYYIKYRYYALIPLLGLALIYGAILVKIQPNRHIVRWVAAFLVALGVMAHYQSGLDFKEDWTIQKSIWNQVRWRCPHIKAGTLLLVNYKPFEHFNVRPQQLHPVANLMFDDGSKELNLFAAPLGGIYGNEMELYDIYPGKQIRWTAKDFASNGQFLLVHYDKESGIAYIPDADLPVLPPAVPFGVRYAARQSAIQMIEAERTTVDHIDRAQIWSTPEAGKNWAYYFQKAQLNRQFGRWAEVVNLQQEAESKDLGPVNNIDWIPFLDAQLHLGHVDEAKELCSRFKKMGNYERGVAFALLTLRSEEDGLKAICDTLLE